MRLSLLALLPFGLLAGCAGNIADHIGPKSGIIAPELTRYGFDLKQSRCVGERLGVSLTPLQLRRLARAAGAVENGYFSPDRLTVRDFDYVAASMGDAETSAALVAASKACGVTGEAAADGKAEAVSPPKAEATPPPAAGSTARAAEWLNLGAAPTGQTIAVDASTIEQDATSRKAWFRLTNPGAAPNGVTYWLRIDCAARIIDPMAHRVQDEAGAVTEHRIYPTDEKDGMPVEGGTVMEIAYLALCT